MPNHIHLFWQLNLLYGRESAKGSFLKFTAHAFKKYLLQTDPQSLDEYAVDAHNKSFEFWQRDSLAFELTNIETALQKLNYMHNNALAKHWLLSNIPAEYYYSSAQYYETGIDTFGFLTHLYEVFDA